MTWNIMLSYSFNLKTTIMKKVISTSAFLFLFLFVGFGQQSKLSFSIVKRLAEENNKNKLAALFVKGNVESVKAITLNNGGSFKYAVNDIAAINLPISKVALLAERNDVLRIEDNSMKLVPMNDSMRVKNNIDAAQMGMAPLLQGYEGEGVIMGIIDSGIDFTHPDFKDSSGNTRVISIWDHNLTVGSAPAPFTYGTEFNSVAINSGGATAHVDNYFGHGTHVTGVAAGSGRAIADKRYRGVAPKADIISVCVNWNLPDDDWLSSVADAVEYIYTKANTLNKPCVINISAGTYFGSHDAKDLQGQIIEGLITAQNKRALICSAGNLGSYPLHTQHNVNIGDTTFTWVKQINYWGPTIYADLWADTADFNQMQIGLAADDTTSGFSLRGSLPYRNINYHLNNLRNDTIYGTSGNRLARVQSFGELIGDRYQIQFIIYPDSNSYHFRFSTTGLGSMDMWSYNYLPNTIFSLPIPNTATYPAMSNYTLPDINQNIVSSFTCSDKVLTVGETGNKRSYKMCNGNIYNLSSINVNGLESASSHGPTRDGRIKPDITASGGITLSAAVLSQVNANKYDSTCMYVRDGGTSTSAPVVAGVAALLFQRYPNANWLDIKNCILGNALVDSIVTTPVPNNFWGYGKLDGFAALTGCSPSNLTGSNVQLIQSNIYPNPFRDDFTIELNNINNYKKNNLNLSITNALGEVVFKTTLKGTESEIIIKPNIHSGIYFYTVTSEKELVSKGKLLKL